MGKKEIQVQQEYLKMGRKQEDETSFDKIYSINICQMSLTEILLLKSFYICSHLIDIVELVRQQPRPLVLYKSCLELNGTNMVSILSFDSRSMSYLLDD